ncbi:ATP-binding protein [Devosia sp.]|uniref:ATP-binding protein n=1 Tax=Devosia sp. TaxID=1871048 RepID=UPI0019FACC50|nr:ATP-binding protein [Devosia sp.]MBE0579368.1 PAS domain-containing protein [Devosia sp.]
MSLEASDAARRGRPGWFSSIAFRLPAAMVALFLLVAVIGGVATYVLRQAKDDLSAYGSNTFASLGAIASISRQTTDLLASAPFLLSATSPYRLATESVSVTRQIDELVAFLSTQPQLVSGTNLTPLPIDEVIVQLKAIRERTVALAEVGANSQASRNGLVEVVNRLTSFNNEESDGSRPNGQLQILALTAASSESLIQLGELQREFAALKLILAASQPDVITTLQSRIFAERGTYLQTVLEIRTVLTAMREASGRLAAATRQYAEIVDVNLGEGLSDTNARLGRLETTILVSLVLVGLISAAIIYYVVVRISRAIAGISASMERLAQGEREAPLPRIEGKETELVRLVTSFSAFKTSVDRESRLRETASKAARIIRSTFRSMTDGIAIFDAQGGPITVNSRMVEILGRGPGARAMKLPELLAELPEVDLSWLSADISPGTSRVVRCRPRPNTLVEMTIARQTDGRIVVTAQDRTELDRQESELRRLQRLEGMTTITQQVAHEIGNMIGIVSGSAGLLETAGALNERQSRHLRRIKKVADRGKALTGSMLAFASHQPLAPEWTDVPGLLRGMQDILELAVGPDRKLALAAAMNLPRVYLDPALLEQSILNLCLNAVAATEAGHVITIRVAKGEDGGVDICVSDPGSGMAPEVLDRAFDPYFTTRTGSGGTGLGLAVVYGFVRQSGGAVDIKSALEKGTAVTLSFPVQVTTM